MTACDVLVENAGGLTSWRPCLRLPLVSFHPIPGHGATRLAIPPGVTYVARDGADLVDSLVRLGRPGPAREAQLAAAAVCFRRCRRSGLRPGRGGRMAAARLRPVVAVARTGATAVFVGALAWLGLTPE